MSWPFALSKEKHCWARVDDVRAGSGDSILNLGPKDRGHRGRGRVGYPRTRSPGREHSFPTCLLLFTGCPSSLQPPPFNQHTCLIPSFPIHCLSFFPPALKAGNVILIGHMTNPMLS